MQTCSLWLTVSYGSVVWCQKHGFLDSDTLRFKCHLCHSLAIGSWTNYLVFFRFHFIMYKWRTQSYWPFRTIKGFEEIMYSTHPRCLILFGQDHRFLEKAIGEGSKCTVFYAFSGHALATSSPWEGYIGQSSNYYNSASYICIAIAWCSGKNAGISIWYPRFKSQLWHLLSPVPLSAK